MVIKATNKDCCLIFVYNADSSLYAQLADALHKATSPETYECNLCKITYGAVSMKKEWREYVESLPFQAHFLHRDQFRAKYPDFAGWELPLIALWNEKVLKSVVSTQELNGLHTVEELKRVLGMHLLLLPE